MKTALMNFKTDPAIKTAVQKKAASLGVSTSFLLEQAVREMLVSETITLKPLIPNKETIRDIKEAIRDRKNGKGGPTFKNMAEAIKYLDNL
jgi:antitoxin component of RelBE/YafQ-DinJ toxin-antitoxin module